MLPDRAAFGGRRRGRQPGQGGGVEAAALRPGRGQLPGQRVGRGQQFVDAGDDAVLFG